MGTTVDVGGHARKIGLPHANTICVRSNSRQKIEKKIRRISGRRINVKESMIFVDLTL